MHKYEEIRFDRNSEKVGGGRELNWFPLKGEGADSWMEAVCTGGWLKAPALEFWLGPHIYMTR